VIAYQIQSDGSLDGQWITIRGGGIGTERAVRADKRSAGGLAGNYIVRGTNTDGSPYRGTLRITARGALYQFSWQAGNTFEGIGVVQGNTVAVGWGADTCAVVSYQVGADGTLRGVWGVYGQSQIGTEEAIRSNKP